MCRNQKRFNILPITGTAVVAGGPCVVGAGVGAGVGGAGVVTGQVLLSIISITEFMSLNVCTNAECSGLDAISSISV